VDIRGNAGLGDTIPTANGPFDLTHFSIRWHLAEDFLLCVFVYYSSFSAYRS